MPDRSIPTTEPINLRLTLAPLPMGKGDPTHRIAADEVWRATRTPAGPATLHLKAVDGHIAARAWGPGADWVLDTAPDLVGAGDDPSRLRPRHRVVRDLARRLIGLRIPRSLAVTESLVRSIVAQKVTSAEAKRSYRRLVISLGEPAPGPSDLVLPPDPFALAALPYYEFHPFGVEQRRAETIRLVCARSNRLEEATSMSPAGALGLLTAVPGVGPWTAAKVALTALGDPDAVKVGDYHLPDLVVWMLAGEPRGDEGRMLELLEPYRGHRGRVVRLLEASGVRAPSFGPRRPARSIERI
ncbi:MAG: DNA-3-methyladenine glycosylase family protein [Acidimicrobiia bacterium]